MDYKKGLIHNLLFCVDKICADYVTLHNKIEFLNQYGKETLFHFSLLTTISKDF